MFCIEKESRAEKREGGKEKVTRGMGKKGAKKGESCEMNIIERYCQYRAYDLRWTD